VRLGKSLHVLATPGSRQCPEINLKSHQSMSNPTIVHQTRQLKGSEFQASSGPTLYALELELRAMGLSHPYRLIRNRVIDQFQPLMANTEFASGGTGPSASTTVDFIYHLTSVRKLVKFTQWSFFPSGFPTPKNAAWRLFEYLIADYHSTSNWLPLRDYASGEYGGFRNFTWWSNLELDPNDIVCRAHKLGLPNKWIPVYAVILRCPAIHIELDNLHHIPTVVDGFPSEIFRPMDFRMSSLTSGQTIDLETNGQLADGVEEFALSPVPVNPIEFKPVLINRHARHHKVVRNARLWQLLEMFYNSL
jgi:hypothetical protein